MLIDKLNHYLSSKMSQQKPKIKKRDQKLKEVTKRDKEEGKVKKPRRPKQPGAPKRKNAKAELEASQKTEQEQVVQPELTEKIKVCMLCAETVGNLMNDIGYSFVQCKK